MREERKMQGGNSIQEERKMQGGNSMRGERKMQGGNSMRGESKMRGGNNMQGKNKMRRKVSKMKKRKKNGRGAMICPLLIVYIVLIVFFICGRQKQQESDGSLLSGFGTDESNGDVAVSSVSLGNINENRADAGNAEEGEWWLTLVNKWNPMKTDGSEVETVELSNGERVDRRIYPHLQSMFDAARENGIYPIVASGYRTAGEQEVLYYDKIAAYRAEGFSEAEAKEAAELWVAVPGTSEHQLGLAVDINADGIYSAGQEVYDWLSKNAYKYGFINRYPEDKTEITGVANEPWHYRYVGTDAAAEIYSQGICLEEYLEN